MTAVTLARMDSSEPWLEDVFRGALHSRLDQVATEVGRLVRRCEPGSSLLALASRLADHIEALDGLISPAADELVPDLFAVCGDEDVAAREALAIVDRRAASVRSRLGTTSA